MARWIAWLAPAVLIAVGMAGCSSEPATPADQAAEAGAPGIETQPSTEAPEAESTSAAAEGAAAGLSVRLEAFEDGGIIPDQYTCLGANDSPAVSWSGVPAAAQSLVLIVYDPDAGADRGAGNDLGFLHWMAYDILPTAGGLPLGATGNAGSLAGGIETANDFSGAAGGVFPGGGPIRGTGYDGPCPPAQHTYVFRMLALDVPLGLPAGTPYQSVMSAWETHVLAVAEWTGIYPPSP